MDNLFVILGGMGTKATELFINELNSKCLAFKDQDYPNYLLFNHASVPDRTDYILGKSKNSPLEFLLEDIRQAENMNPMFYALPCNTAFYFYETLCKSTNAPILNMHRF